MLKPCTYIYSTNSTDIDSGNCDKEEERAEIIHLAKELGRNKELTEDQAARLAAAKIAEGEHHSPMWYKVNARRGLTGGHKLIPKINSTLKDVSIAENYCIIIFM